MNKIILTIGLICLFIVSALSPIVFGYKINISNESPFTLSRSNTLYVGGSGPGNYTKIQDAIDNASNDDTIYVYNGTYPHNVWIDKSISLVGENKNNTIIEGGWLTLVTIDTDDVIVTGFTVRDCGFYYSGGIHICGKSSNVTIIGNNLSNNIICGISISGDNNYILNNTLKDNYNGIKLAGNNNTIAGNVIESNNRTGIYYVWIRSIGKSYDPIYQNNIIKENIIINNAEGIYVERSNNSLIYNNLIANNRWTGVYAPDNDPGDEYYPYKNNTKIENNTIINNGYGIIFFDSNRTTITDNIIALNNRSISLYDCNKTLIYHNNIVNNLKPPKDENGHCDNYKNQWDNGYPSGGNYWSDYNESDNYSGPNQDIPGEDGIGDISYNISGNANSQDRYPLMEPWNNSPPNSPFINGPTNGKVGIDYNYTFISTDPDEDDIWYYISWGDKEIIYIYGPYSSGETITLSYNWSNKGNYIIQCKAMDENYLESDWTEFEVTMPRNRAIMNTPFLNFLESHPILYQLLQRFLRL